MASKAQDVCPWSRKVCWVGAELFCHSMELQYEHE